MLATTDGQKNGAYDFSFYQFNPNNSFAANPSSQVISKELKPTMIHSEPVSHKKDKDMIGSKADMINNKSKKGVHMNIEKYNERRQAKIARF